MKNKIIFADSLRGLAALSVVLSHVLLAFWLPGREVSEFANVPPLPTSVVVPTLTRSILDTPMVFSLGAFGVGLFFLISGFVIPLSIDSLNRAMFIWGRAWRIVPTYVAGFLVTVTALGLSSWLYVRPFPYSASHVLLHTVPGLRAVLNLKSIDSIVWTLEIEMPRVSFCSHFSSAAHC